MNHNTHRLSVEHLTCNLLKRGARHPHEALARWRSQDRAFGRSRGVALHEHIAIIRQNGSRAATAVAQVRHNAIYTDYFLDGHSIYLLFLIFLMNQNHAFWFIDAKGGGCV